MKLYLTADGHNVKRVHLSRRDAIEDASDNALTFIEVDAELYVESFAFDQGLVDLRLFGKTQQTQLAGVSPDSPRKSSQ
jgi:hypothetical protein